MQVRLEVAHSKANHKKVILKRDTLIGRSAECNLRIASKEVSRKHCQITLTDEGVTVRDLGSSNGTFVNGYKLDADTDYSIAPDSELSVGGVKFVVRYAAPGAAGPGSTVDLKKHATETEDSTESEASAAAVAAALAGAAAPASVEAALPADDGETLLVDNEEAILADEEEPLFADEEEPLFADEEEPLFAEDEDKSATVSTAAEPVAPADKAASDDEPLLADEEDEAEEPLFFEDESPVETAAVETSAFEGIAAVPVDEDEPIFAVDEPADESAVEFSVESEPEPLAVDDAADELGFVGVGAEPADAEERTADLSDVNLGSAAVDEDESAGPVESQLEESLEDEPIFVDEQPEEIEASELLLAAGDATVEPLDEPLLDEPLAADAETAGDEEWLAFDDEPARDASASDASAELLADTPTEPAAGPLAEGAAEQASAESDTDTQATASEDETGDAASDEDAWGFAAGDEEPVEVDTSEDDAFAFLTDTDDEDAKDSNDPGELGDFLKSLGDKDG